MVGMFGFGGAIESRDRRVRGRGSVGAPNDMYEKHTTLYTTALVQLKYVYCRNLFWFEERARGDAPVRL
jgi:hypothetical protein